MEQIYLKSNRKYDECNSGIIETDKSNILSHNREIRILRHNRIDFSKQIKNLNNDKLNN